MNFLALSHVMSCPVPCIISYSCWWKRNNCFHKCEQVICAGLFWASYIWGHWSLPLYSSEYMRVVATCYKMSCSVLVTLKLSVRIMSVTNLMYFFNVWFDSACQIVWHQWPFLWCTDAMFEIGLFYHVFSNQIRQNICTKMSGFVKSWLQNCNFWNIYRNPFVQVKMF